MIQLIDKLTIILVFLIPLEGIVIFNGVTLSRVTAMLIILVYFTNLLLTRGNIQLNKITIFYLLYISLIILSGIFFPQINIFSSRAISIYSNLFLIISIYNTTLSEYKIIQIMKSFAFGLFIANIIAIVEPFFGYRGTFHVVGLGSNLYAVYCLLGFFINVFFVINYRIIKNIYQFNLHILFALINLHGLIIADSRLNLIYLVSFMLLLYINLEMAKTMYKKIIFLIVFISFASYIYYVQATKYDISFDKIMLDSRIIHWIANFDMFLDYPFTGVGFGQYGENFGYTYQFFYDTVKDYGSDRSHHSTFLGSMAEFGLLGILFWISFFYFQIMDYKKYANNKNKNSFGLSTNYFIHFLALICTIGIITSDMITYKLFWIIFIMKDRILKLRSSF